MPDKENQTATFADRHIGPRFEDIQRMLTTLGYASMEDFIEDVVPADIRLSADFVLNEGTNCSERNLQPYIAKSEAEVLTTLKQIAS